MKVVFVLVDFWDLREVSWETVVTWTVWAVCVGAFSLVFGVW